MEPNSIVDLLRPVVDKFELLGDYVSHEEAALALDLAKKLRAIYDTAVERLTSGRVS